MELNVDIFSYLDKGWALLTAGDSIESFNSMTVSWGEMGTLWGKPVATVYVRDSRYTLDFMKNSEYFTLTFFPEENRGDLKIMGSKSGRDMDKVALTGLHPEALEHGVGYKEANRTLVLKKMYCQKMDMDAMIEEVRAKWYADNDNHNMFIGEVVAVL